MDSNRFKIVGLGEILWDIYEDEKFLGGAPANFAFHCQQLGDTGIIASRVGNDELGQELLDSLNNRELSIDFIQKDFDYPTGTVKVMLDDQSKPHFECTTNVAFDYLQMNDQLRHLAKNADAVLFGTLSQRNKVSRETIQTFLKISVHSFKIYDINLRGWDENIEKIVLKSLVLADAIKLNDEELNILRNAWQRELEDTSFLQYLIMKYSLKFAALTLGENGCILVGPDRVVQQKGIKIKPKDTTGCGDAFAAALIHQYLREKPLDEIASFSNLLGAYIALFVGATPDYTQSDLARLKKEYLG